MYNIDLSYFQIFRMNKFLLPFTIVLFCIQSVNAQTLYMSRDVQAAFKKGTRAADGKPGKNYWQNHARYDITMTVLPPDRNVRGTEQISYVNNSPEAV